MSEQTYDVVVIGAGPVGENVADRAVAGGLTAVVVERELVGGECSYWACMPTKALLRSGAALRAATSVAGAREAVTRGLDADAVLRRRDSFASSWKDDGQVDWLTSAGIASVRGHGRLAGDRQVEVVATDGSTTTLHARHAVVVATGTRALVPDLPGLRAASPWTSREAVATDTVPGRLLVVGAGVVATELATAFSGLGSTVTVLARDGVIPHVEPFAGQIVLDSLTEAGADVRLGEELAEVDRLDDGTVRATLGDGSTVDADEVLVAVGRAPSTNDLGLPDVGLVDGQWLAVDDGLHVLDAEGSPMDWLFAAGDVNRRALLTHQGKYQARALGDAIVARAHGAPVDLTQWGRHAATADLRAVPQVIFTDPEVAAVGLSEAAARDAGLTVRAVDHDLGAVAGAALHADDYRGRARMVVDEDRGVLVGFTVVGPDVAELLQAATIAIVGEVPLERLWHAVPAYPTISEVWLRLLEAYGRPS